MALPSPDLTQALAQPGDAQPEGLVRVLGVRALAANVVNYIIGSGIFVLPAVAAAALGPAAVAAYVVCAIAMGLIIACYAEAGSCIARSGGSYAYAEAAFGPYVGFVVGVVLNLANVAALAAVAAALVGTAAEAFPLLAHPAARVGMLAAFIGGVAYVNVLGVRQGARFVLVATVAKLLPLIVLVIVGLPAVNPEFLAWTSAPEPAALGAASLVLLFAFTGGESALTASGEVRNSGRTVPLALALGLGVVLAFYLALQAVAQGVLGPDLAGSTAAPLAEAAGRLMGGGGRTLLLAGAAVSMGGWVVGDILASPRLLFAQARDGFLLGSLARVHSDHHTPHVAIWVYAGVGCILAATGTFARLAALSVVALLLVYLVVCAAVPVLRKKRIAEAGEPYRLPGGVLIPALAVAVVIALLTQATATEYLALGIALVVSTAAFFLRRATPASEDPVS